MIRFSNGICAFGCFEGLQYDDNCHETFEEYRKYHNILPKEVIIQHIEQLPIAYTSMRTYDLFTGEKIGNGGLYNDGIYTFPIDFLRYYKTMDIGIPPEYEQYLIDEVGLKP